MTIDNVTPAVLLSMLLSLSMEWLPKLRDWWAAQGENRKRGLMALGVAAISLGTMAFNCWGRGQCPADWWIAVRDVLFTMLVAATANQVTHLLNPYRPAALPH